MLTSKLTWKQIKKAHEHFLFEKKLDKAFIKLPPKKMSEAKAFFLNLKKIWDEADEEVTSWFTKTVEPAIKDAFDYFLTKLQA